MPDDDRQLVTLEELRRDLATAVAQAGIECEAKHVALNEIKALRAKVEAYAARLAETSDSPTGNLIGLELLRLLRE